MYLTQSPYPVADSCMASNEGPPWSITHGLDYDHLEQVVKANRH